MKKKIVHNLRLSSTSVITNGKAIYKKRVSKGWTQQELADAAVLSLDTIQRAERGSPIRKVSLRNIAKALEIDYKYLLKLPLSRLILIYLTILSIIALVIFLSYYLLYLPKTIKSLSLIPIDNFPSAKIAVISDLNLCSPSLIDTTSADFKEWSSAELGIMWAESNVIITTLIKELKASDVDIVLITGDLTMDGALINHKLCAEFLSKLEEDGKKVYVVPGNRDINNSQSYNYSKSPKEKIANVSPQKFVNIYNGFGFKEALYRDSSSLTYVVEPIKGLWIVCIDACRYNDNPPDDRNIIEGRLSKETRFFIKSKIQQARINKSVIFGMMHHQILEHIKGQYKFLGGAYRPFIIKDFKIISTEFASEGMNIIFSGGMHSQDITRLDTNGTFLFDIETGSPTTYPSSYRVINLSHDGKLSITSKYIQQIQYDLGNKSFKEYSKHFAFTRKYNIVYNTLIKSKIPENIAKNISELCAQAMIAHNIGDENPHPSTLSTLHGYANSNNLSIHAFAKTIIAAWRDLPPSDLNLTINLKNGTTN